ncbi:hypothetical protein SPONN_276 [uncultured Candidatus Thioglobus sp.]|nr:hypothetical protein SPONN_276 [uncultured Candidatus Thioglobus sp.]
MIDKELVLLNAIAPLDKKAKKQIWKNISAELEFGLMARLKNLFKFWHALVLLVSMALFTSLAPNANTILDASKTGWDATLESNQLFIKAVNPMEVGKTEVCVLWIKKHGVTSKITELPESGNKNVNLNQFLMAQLDGGMVIISIEKKNNIKQPKTIEYSKQL